MLKISKRKNGGSIWDNASHEFKPSSPKLSPKVLGAALKARYTRELRRMRTMLLDVVDVKIFFCHWAICYETFYFLQVYNELRLDVIAWTLWDAFPIRLKILANGELPQNTDGLHSGCVMLCYSVSGNLSVIYPVAVPVLELESNLSVTPLLSILAVIVSWINERSK